MAEEFVGKDQFGEFTKRMEQGFDHVNQQFGHVNQQFDQVNRRLDQVSTDMRQIRTWIIGLYGIVVFGFIGSIFATIIKGSIK